MWLRALRIRAGVGRYKTVPNGGLPAPDAAAVPDAADAAAPAAAEAATGAADFAAAADGSGDRGSPRADGIYRSAPVPLLLLNVRRRCILEGLRSQNAICLLSWRERGLLAAAAEAIDVQPRLKSRLLPPKVTACYLSISTLAETLCMWSQAPPPCADWQAPPQHQQRQARRGCRRRRPR